MFANPEGRESVEVVVVRWADWVTVDDVPFPFGPTTDRAGEPLGFVLFPGYWADAVGLDWSGVKAHAAISTIVQFFALS